MVQSVAGCEVVVRSAFSETAHDLASFLGGPLKFSVEWMGLDPDIDYA